MFITVLVVGIVTAIFWTHSYSDQTATQRDLFQVSISRVVHFRDTPTAIVNDALNSAAVPSAQQLAHEYSMASRAQAMWEQSRVKPNLTARGADPDRVFREYAVATSIERHASDLARTGNFQGAKQLMGSHTYQRTLARFYRDDARTTRGYQQFIDRATVQEHRYWSYLEIGMIGCALAVFLVLSIGVMSTRHWILQTNALKLAAERDGERNNLVLDTAGEAIVGLDFVGRVVFANPVAQHYLPSEGVLRGLSVHSMLHERDGGDCTVENCLILAAFAAGERRDGETRFAASASDELDLAFSITPVSKGNHESGLTHVLVFRDISDRMAG